MINSYFRSIKRDPNISPYTPYSSFYSTQQQQHNQSHKNKYKIFIIILNKATQRTLQDGFDQILNKHKKIIHNLTRLSTLSEKNINLCIHFCFDKLKSTIRPSRDQDKLIKNCLVLLQRIQKYKLKQAFANILTLTLRYQK